jgi:NAD(P)-dependent dehydrogenase (short-subunit alcohol dehydrogenase family)
MMGRMADTPPPPASGPVRALVTGGNGNLGHAVSRLLLEAGFETHVTVLDEKTRASYAYGLMQEGLTIHVGDLSRGEDVARVFQELATPLATVVATVGGFHGGPLKDIDEATVYFK